MKAKIVNKSEIKDALNIHGLPGELIAQLALNISGLRKLNKIYSHIAEYQGVAFSNHLLEYLGITIDFNTEAFENIPLSGAVVFTCNHPFGGLDSMVALSLLGKIRPDLKILTSVLIAKIPNTASFFIPVDTTYWFGKYLRNSFKGLRQAEEHLYRGGALVMFPAKEVSSYDKEWKSALMKMIKRCNSAVFPFYFHGSNSKYFQLLDKFSNKLGSLRLPGELNNKKGQEIKVRLGSIIKPVEIKEQDYRELAEYLRNRTYALEAGITEPYENVCSVPLAEPVAVELLNKELSLCQKDKLFDVEHLSCYLLDYKDIPNLMKEIGIRREEAFRAVGEGTNTACDTDSYDTYYKHLVLWDNKSNDLVGAYRIALGDEILEQKGRHGFYSDTLFRYSEGFEDTLRESVELGRSFVTLSHQKDTLALILLLKGLFYAMIKYPKYRYLLGPVSISSWYPPLYRTLMIKYLRHSYGNRQMAGFVSPKCPFVPEAGRVDIQALVEGKMDNLEVFDRAIYRMSGGLYKFPPLLKKYIKLGARLIDYNVDPDFNNCVDGLIILNLEDIPTDDLDSLSREFDNKAPIYRRFYNW